jgi:hypothetical protein
MTHQQLVDRHYAEINNKDFSDVADLFGSDVVTQVPDAGLLTGIEPFVAYGAPTPVRCGRRPVSCRPRAGRWSCLSPTSSVRPTGRSPSTASTTTLSVCLPSSVSCPLPLRPVAQQGHSGWGGQSQPPVLGWGIRLLYPDSGPPARGARPDAQDRSVAAPEAPTPAPPSGHGGSASREGDDRRPPPAAGCGHGGTGPVASAG